MVPRAAWWAEDANGSCTARWQVKLCVSLIPQPCKPRALSRRGETTRRPGPGPLLDPQLPGGLPGRLRGRPHGHLPHQLPACAAAEQRNERGEAIPQQTALGHFRQGPCNGPCHGNPFAKPGGAQGGTGKATRPRQVRAPARGLPGSAGRFRVALRLAEKDGWVRRQAFDAAACAVRFPPTRKDDGGRQGCDKADRTPRQLSSAAPRSW